MATEKRLIYLEDAIAKIVDTPSAIAERVFNGDYGYDQNPDMLVDRQHEIIDLLMDVPTVEVVHGRWECEHETWGRLQCSNCKKEALLEKSNGDVGTILLYVTSNYCPNCGANMKGK